MLLRNAIAIDARIAVACLRSIKLAVSWIAKSGMIGRKSRGEMRTQNPMSVIEKIADATPRKKRVRSVGPRRAISRARQITKINANG